MVPVILPSTAPIHKSSIVEGGGSKQAPVPRGTSPMGAKILKKIRNKVQQRATPNASAAESGMVTKTFFSFTLFTCFRSKRALEQIDRISASSSTTWSAIRKKQEKASYAIITIGRQCCFENFFPCYLHC